MFTLFARLNSEEKHAGAICSKHSLPNKLVKRFTDYITQIH